jgi:hypothetical protein
MWFVGEESTVCLARATSAQRELPSIAGCKLHLHQGLGRLTGPTPAFQGSWIVAAILPTENLG